MNVRWHSNRPEGLWLRRLQWGCLALALSLLGTVAQAVELPELMQSLGKHQERQGRFEETKTLAVLSKPVRSIGEVRYRAPDFFEKKNWEPNSDLMRVDGDKLYVERDGRPYHIRLSRQPQAAAFVNAIKGLLTGDASLLERNYTVALSGQLRNWRLQMVPKDKAMADIISKVIATGDQNQVRSIEYWQADGDRSVMVIEPLQP